MWQAFWVSAGVVALGEIGDKTQLLALLLAARLRRPLPIILGILVATLANHALASAAGAWITRHIDPQWLRWALGASFLAFFVAEMGDKTQIATVMLAAKFDSVWLVTAGTTLGMMLANVPAVLLGERVTRWVPVHWVHRIAAAVFAVLGVLVLAGFGR